MRTLCLLLLLTLASLSCSNDHTVTIKVDITDPELNQLIITNEVEMIYDTILLPSEETVDLDLQKSPSIFLLQSGRINHYIYVVAGGEITISMTSEDEDLTIGGSNAKEQELLSAFSKSMDIANSKYNMMEISNASESAFRSNLERKYSRPRAFLAEQKDEGVDPELMSLLEGRITADYYASLVNYPQYYEYLKKEEVQLPKDYYNEVKGFDFNSSSLFYFNDVINAAQTVAGRSFDFEDFDSMADYYGAQFENIDKLSDNPKVVDLLKYRLLNAKINFSGGTSGMEDEIEQFITESKDPVRKRAMRNEIKKWEHLQAGKPAPDFTAYTTEGEEVSLSDLKGKNVYIDFWATWCGPCLAEIPALKEMERKYASENMQFVSVSLDKEEDWEKWRKFVESKELSGIQIMSRGVGSSEITSQYNISSIPRFIMINDYGAIVDAEAPRPSNTAAFSKMMGFVLE